MIIAFACCTFAAGVAAQEKVQLRLVPQPDQWVQFHMVQEMATAPSDNPGANVVPDMQVKSVATFTQTTGHPDADGRVRAEVTYDEMSATMTTGGKTTPVPMPSSLVGQQMIATYDAQGKLVDIQTPGEMPARVVAQDPPDDDVSLFRLGVKLFRGGRNLVDADRYDGALTDDAGARINGSDVHDSPLD